jgi:hypothetical protein
MCLTTFLCSCKDNEDEIIKKAEQIKHARFIKENNPIKISKTITLKDDGSHTFHTEEITIFEFDGCEYIMYKKHIDTRWGVLGLTHKGNCKYCSKSIKN